jgi:hypothetical protein
MDHRPALWSLIALGLGVAAAIPDAAAQFRPSCEIPFRHIASSGLDIDSCPAEGDGKTDAHRAQNVAKNNLCARGRPIPLSFSAFKRLQKAVDDKAIVYGSSQRLPSNRKDLQEIISHNGKKIGEGSLVQYVGFIHHPRYSNRSKGESVNCKRPGAANNDIHVDVVRARSEPVCRSITVEIIPHFRPEQWEVDKLKMIEHPVRFTGQLFFDASHKPCKNDTEGPTPKRASVWEIHPVYAIDVCKSRQLGRCSATDKNVWIALDAWVNKDYYEEDDD